MKTIFNKIYIVLNFDAIQHMYTTTPSDIINAFFIMDVVVDD